jgi:hypothetical protein
VNLAGPALGESTFGGFELVGQLGVAG